MTTLSEIMEKGDPREIRRASSVSLRLCGVDRDVISKALYVSIAFVDKWNSRYSSNGPDCLLLQYKGSQGYLEVEERKEIIAHLKRKKDVSIDYLVEYIECNYGVVYESKQSYYDILHEARYSWKKSEKENPKRDDELVKAKRDEIEKILVEHMDEIISGRLAVWVEDECHLLWGDTCGYVWGKKNKKTTVQIVNQKQRTTFYGAFNYYSHKVAVKEYEAGNSENTINYLEHLRLISNFEKILVIWDGASYHRFSGIPEYLKKMNECLSEEDWKVRCILLSPHAPDQNPMEDIWLKGKNWLRKNFRLNKTFQDVVDCFTDFFNTSSFDFPKMSIFGTIQLR